MPSRPTGHPPLRTGRDGDASGQNRRREKRALGKTSPATPAERLLLQPVRRSRPVPLVGPRRSQRQRRSAAERTQPRAVGPALSDQPAGCAEDGAGGVGQNSASVRNELRRCCLTRRKHACPFASHARGSAACVCLPPSPRPAHFAMERCSRICDNHRRRSQCRVSAPTAFVSSSSLQIPLLAYAKPTFGQTLFTAPKLENVLPGSRELKLVQSQMQLLDMQLTTKLHRKAKPDSFGFVFLQWKHG